MKRKAFYIPMFLIFAAVSLTLALMIAPLRKYNTNDVDYSYKENIISSLALDGKIKDPAVLEKNYQIISNSLNIPNKVGSMTKSNYRFDKTEDTETPNPLNFTFPENQKKSVNVFSEEALNSKTNIRPVSNKIALNTNTSNSYTTTSKSTAPAKTTKKLVAGMPPPEEGDGSTPTPTPTPNLPVGDGLSFLLLLTLGLTVFKSKKLF